MNKTHATGLKSNMQFLSYGKFSTKQTEKHKNKITLGSKVTDIQSLTMAP